MEVADSIITFKKGGKIVAVFPGRRFGKSSWGLHSLYEQYFACKYEVEYLGRGPKKMARWAL